MTNIKMLLLYGAVYFATIFLMAIAGSYIKCFFGGVDYNWSILLPRALKGSAFLSSIFAVLQYFVNAIPSKNSAE